MNTFNYLNFSFLAFLSMGLGMLNFGCDHSQKIIVKNSLDTACVVELKLKEVYTKESFAKEFGLDSTEDYHFVFIAGPADSAIETSVDWPLIKRSQISFDEKNQLISLKVDPHQQVVVDFRLRSHMEISISSLRVHVASQNQEFFMSGNMLANSVKKNQELSDVYVVECK